MAEITTALAYTSAFVSHALASFCFSMAMSILLSPAYYKVHPAPCSPPTTSTELIHAVDKANDGEEDMDDVPYAEWMPKQTTLQDHSTMDLTRLPVAVAQLVSELDKHHWFGQDDQEIPQAIHISSGGPCDVLHDACQAQQVCAVDEICQIVEPRSAPACTANQTQDASSPCVIIQPSAQVDTTPRREKSLYGAKIQVGLAISTVNFADVFAIRVELACPDNGDGHLVATAMWCLTATIAEVENLRDGMQPDVDDSEMLLLYEFDTSDDMQTFFDAVTARQNWSDVPALRRFCQMW
ncbi:hypothetical protein AC1031_012149 [Aphanomyces cochlioides]|nr:hypothetical protein AC1031_012149 [Aphanomyces cochlioides]